LSLFFHVPELVCPWNKIIAVRTKTNRNNICFGCVLVCFVNQKLKISVCYGRFVSVFWTNIETTETNRTVSKLTKTNQNNPKFSEKYPNMLSFKLFWLVLCLFRFNWNIETLSFGIEAKQPKQTILKQTKTNQKTLNFLKNYQNMLSIKLFQLLICSFGSIETPQLSISVKKRNNRNKCFVSDSAENSFGCCFVCFESKLVLKDTLFGAMNGEQWNKTAVCLHHRPAAWQCKAIIWRCCVY
jgi:hypothetical protein